jgi:hypothetical protein
MSKRRHRPLVFVSYAPFDDKHDRGRITSFARVLSDEAKHELGGDVSVFYDRRKIQIGEQWEDAIRDALEKASVFVAIITPSYFRSRFCRQELEHILDREERLNRSDMIIPVFYVGIEGLLGQDDLGEKLAKRQYLDWRELRFEPFDSLQVRQSMLELVHWIGIVIERT